MIEANLKKSALRKKYLAKRLGLSKAAVFEKSSQIAKKLLSRPELTCAAKIALYLPIHNEVETKEIIDSLIANGKKVFLPKYLGNTPGVREVFDYCFVPFTGWQNLEVGPFGILQPSQANTRGVKLGRNLANTPRVSRYLDVVILPGIAFDKFGVRLGYGKGVFDRLLANSHAFKIGLAYDFQIVDELPKEKHDLVMDWVVTD